MESNLARRWCRRLDQAHRMGEADTVTVISLKPVGSQAPHASRLVVLGEANRMRGVAQCSVRLRWLYLLGSECEWLCNAPGPGTEHENEDAYHANEYRCCATATLDGS